MTVTNDVIWADEVADEAVAVEDLERRGARDMASSTSASTASRSAPSSTVPNTWMSSSSGTTEA